MRKIEQQMLNAIRNRKRWQSGNTAVTPMCEGDDCLMLVYLHGHNIANVGASEIAFTLAGWPTVTTRSRLNAILRTLADAVVYQRNGAQMLSIGNCDGGSIGSNSWVKVSRLEG